MIISNVLDISTIAMLIVRLFSLKLFHVIKDNLVSRISKISKMLMNLNY